MPLSMYDLTVPVFLRGFTVLSGYLEKAAAHAHAEAVEPSTIIQARLAPDMFTFAGQIQSASDKARRGLGRLAAIQVPSFPDTERTFGELEARIANTVAFLRSVDRQLLESSETRTVELKSRSTHRTYRGDEYLLTTLLPDFFFHIATAHGILRHVGVPIGKSDYLRRG